MNEVAQKVKDRLSEFIAYLGLNNSTFEKRCGLSNGYIRNFKGNLGTQKLEGILKEFPQLNKEWLLFGKGSMLIDSENQPENPVEEQPQDRTMLDRLFAIVESQKDDINTLIQLVKEKDSKIEELIDELNAYKYKGETAHTVGDSSSADAV